MANRVTKTGSNQVDHLKVWDSSNLAESFPGIVAPLTFSIAKHGYMLAYKSQAHEAGLTWYEIEANHRMFDSMIGIFNGRLYYNLANWYSFISLFPGSGNNQRFLDEQISTHGSAVYKSPPKLKLGYKVRFVMKAVGRTIFFSREVKAFYVRYAAFEIGLAALPVADDLEVLMDRYKYIEQQIVPHFGRTVDNDFFVMVYNGFLKRLLSSVYAKKELESLAPVAKINQLASAGQATALYDLAAKCQDDGTAAKLLRTKKFIELDEYLNGNELRDQIDQYLAEYGHRFASDQKIEIPNPILAPNGIYELLATYIQLDADTIRERLKMIDSRSANKQVARRLPILKRPYYYFLVSRLGKHLRIREHNRLLRGKTYGLMRELFPTVGRTLAAADVISREDDVFYLQIDEIFELIQGALVVNDLKDRVKKRREAYQQYESIEMPIRFVTTAVASLETVTTTPTRPQKASRTMPGIVSSAGTVEGRAVVLDKPVIPREPFDILIASHTDPGWTPLIALAKGVVVEHGGMLSHAAIVTRELGIPALIGVTDVTKNVKTGMRVRLNGQLGALEILPETKAHSNVAPENSRSRTTHTID